MRQHFDIPNSAIVIGSFQKDGAGWKDGFEPKLIKGPDAFLKTVGVLKESLPELFILLSVPTRGYIKQGLSRLGIPYAYSRIKRYEDMGRLYHTLDLYLVSLRDEGGPQSILESLSSGIPLVTTKVGQAMDLIHHQSNGWMVDRDDYEALRPKWAKFMDGFVVNRCS